VARRSDTFDAPPLSHGPTTAPDGRFDITALEVCRPLPRWVDHLTGISPVQRLFLSSKLRSARTGGQVWAVSGSARTLRERYDVCRRRPSPANPTWGSQHV
jgi:hypothetical protein